MFVASVGSSPALRPGQQSEPLCCLHSLLAAPPPCLSHPLLPVGPVCTRYVRRDFRDTHLTASLPCFKCLSDPLLPRGGPRRSLRGSSRLGTVCLCSPLSTPPLCNPGSGHSEYLSLPALLAFFTAGPLHTLFPGQQPLGRFNH